MRIFTLFSAFKIECYFERGGRVVEGARLESVYTPQGYRGFESLPLQNDINFKNFIIILYL